MRILSHSLHFITACSFRQNQHFMIRTKVTSNLSQLTELQQQQPLCISINALYKDVGAALQNHKTLQNMLQQNSQQ